MAYVQVEIDIDDYLDEASTKALEYELQSRQDFHVGSPSNLVRDALEALYRHKPEEAVVLLERHLRPKWHDLETCQKEYKQSLEFARNAAKVAGISS